MAPNKSWMKLAQDDRINVEYEMGVDKFVAYAIEKTGQDNINKKKTIGDALKEVPNHLTSDDWEWLVKEHFLNDKVQGGKHGNKPSISDIFNNTRMRKCGSLDEESSEKFDEIVDVERENPNLSQFEVVEKCFGEQNRDHVACFGFGMKPKDVRGPLPSREELINKLREKEKENDELRQSINEIKESNKSLEEKVEMLMSKVLGNHSTSVNHGS